MGGAGAEMRSSRIGIVGGFGSRVCRLCRVCRFGGVCVAVRVGQLLQPYVGLVVGKCWVGERRLTL